MAKAPTNRWLLPAALIACLVGAAHAANDLRPLAYGEPREICKKLEDKRISESSGLAPSRLHPGVFWTHNDSGDGPRLFAFDDQGTDLGTCEVRGARADDWEDMASFSLNGQAYLLLGDTGDNGRRRKHCTLYLVPEPDRLRSKMKATVARTIKFQYEGGPVDCEAVGIDTARREILLVQKRIALSCRVFRLPLPDEETEETLIATPIARIRVPIVTAMDVSPDGLRAIVLTLGHAYEFTRTADEDWSVAFARDLRTVEMPARKQGETICYGANGEDLYLTSEKRPTPLFKVPAISRGQSSESRGARR